MPTWPHLNLTAGPAAVSARTLRDAARPILYHYDPAFIELFAHTSSLLQQVYRTRYDVVIMPGEAVLGLEAAAASLIAPGDKVLTLVSGVFGAWFGGLVRQYGGEPVELAVPNNEAIDSEAVRDALQRHPDVKFLSVVHSETPSGTLNPVKEIGQVAREFGVLTIVDTVSGLGGEAVEPEAFGIDVAVAGPQKCLGGTPGVALLAVSPAAWTAMERRQPPLTGSALSILDWKRTWLERQRFPSTPPVSVIYALESALTQVLDEGIERHVARHAAIARACRAGVAALGLDFWAAREAIAASCVTAVAPPAGVDEARLRQQMRDRYGVAISGGYGDVSGKLFRLGHMGPAAHPTTLAAQLAIIERSLADLGHPVEFGAGVGAAMTTLADWDGNWHHAAG